MFLEPERSLFLGDQATKISLKLTL